MTELGGLEERLVAAFDGGEALLVALAVAFVAGALHAARPGHGKTLAAAVLVGPNGRPVHAAALGLSVAGMHTCSVAVLAVAWHLFMGAAGDTLGRTTATMQLLAAAVAVAVAIGMLTRHLRSRRDHEHEAGHDHLHDLEAGHDHRHDVEAGHDHGHTHLPPASTDGPPITPWSARGLAAVAVSGGLVPSPSTFLILVTGMLAGRLLVAMALVAAFALGLAGTLTVVGLLAISGRSIMTVSGSRVPWLGRLATQLPLVAAVGVLVGAAILGVDAIGQLTA